MLVWSHLRLLYLEFAQWLHQHFSALSTVKCRRKFICLMISIKPEWVQFTLLNYRYSFQSNRYFPVMVFNCLSKQLLYALRFLPAIANMTWPGSYQTAFRVDTNIQTEPSTGHLLVCRDKPYKWPVKVCKLRSPRRVPASEKLFLVFLLLHFKFRTFNWLHVDSSLRHDHDTTNSSFV